MSTQPGKNPAAGRSSRPVVSSASEAIERGPRAPVVLGLLAALALVAFVAFMALGTWQVERRAWKLDLIERVDQRVNAPAVAAPPPARWAQVNANDNAYQHVAVSGTFSHTRETLVQAVTDLGSGFWVLTPLMQADGTTVLINRGFVPNDKRDRATRLTSEPASRTTVTGLLRITEPRGGFLRENDAAGDKWYSRDVAAIAAARGLEQTAPYFIDADATVQDAGAGFSRRAAAQPATRNSPFGKADSLAAPEAPNPDGVAPTWPAGGLTVIAFPNNHLVYAITWYGLALMVAAAAWYLARVERRLRRRQASPAVRTTLRS